MAEHPESEWKGLVTAFPESGTPSQENVDQSFKFFTDIQIYLDSTIEELESYKNAAFKDRKEKIERLIDNIKTEITEKLAKKAEDEASNNPIVEKIKARMEVIKPLIEPPGANLEKIATYLADVASYFAKPYTDMVKILSFYGQYIPQMANKIAQTTSSIQQTISNLESEKAAIIAEAAKYKNGINLDIAQLEIAKTEEELSSKLNSLITIKRNEE